MYPRDLFNRALTAASVAQANGFNETSLAFQELALSIYYRMSSAERRLVPDGTQLDDQRVLEQKF